MTDKLNDLLTRLAHQPLDRSLTRLELDVQRVLSERQHSPFAWAIFEPLQFATLSLALFIGITIGGINGASKATTTQASLMAPDMKLAVSTILEGG